MSHLLFTRSTLHVCISLVTITAFGCATPYKVAEVEGRLTIAGKPADKIHIQFIPPARAGVKLPFSNADTDEQGKFTLEMREANRTINGAVVGTNRVVLSDEQYAAAAGRDVPYRLKSDYTLPSSTPLTQEVVEGKQTIEIKLP